MGRRPEASWSVSTGQPRSSISLRDLSLIAQGDEAQVEAIPVRMPCELDQEFLQAAHVQALGKMEHFNSLRCFHDE